jgi:CheY-like chemotaxis protein
VVKIPNRRFHALSVLLVDDDPDVRDTTRETLEYLGLKVVQAPNGPEAIRLLQLGEWRPDLAVLDYHMPLMNGLEVLQALRALQPNLRAILCSGSIGPETVRDSGMPQVELLPKPFRMAQMESALRAMLGLEDSQGRRDSLD